MRAALACMLLLSALALAGCSSTPSTPSSSSSSTTGASGMLTTAPPPTSSSYNVTLSGFPTTPIAEGAQFTFEDHVDGAIQRTSDHIGAHFGANTTSSPSTTAYPNACVHTHGDLPGVYSVTCTAPMKDGTYFLRGHARITKSDNSTVSWWSSEVTFTVVPPTTN